MGGGDEDVAARPEEPFFYRRQFQLSLYLFFVFINSRCCIVPLIQRGRTPSSVGVPAVVVQTLFSVAEFFPVTQ